MSKVLNAVLQAESVTEDVIKIKSSLLVPASTEAGK